MHRTETEETRASIFLSKNPYFVCLFLLEKKITMYQEEQSFLSSSLSMHYSVK